MGRNTVTVLPTIIGFIAFFKGFEIDKINNKMEILVNLGLIMFLFLNIFDLKHKLIALKKIEDYGYISSNNFFNMEIK